MEPGKIYHYEVTRGYAEAREGLRFDACRKSSEGSDAAIARGLAEALDISISRAAGSIRCNIKYKEI